MKRNEYNGGWSKRCVIFVFLYSTIPSTSSYYSSIDCCCVVSCTTYTIVIHTLCFHIENMLCNNLCLFRYSFVA